MNTGRGGTDSAANSSTVAIYVAAIIILSVTTVGSIVAILALRPHEDNTSIIAALIGFVTPVMLGILALISRENHLAMNSRLDQLIASTDSTARAEGIAAGTTEGAAAEQARGVALQEARDSMPENAPRRIRRGDQGPQPVVVVDATKPIEVEVVEHRYGAPHQQSDRGGP